LFPICCKDETRCRALTCRCESEPWDARAEQAADAVSMTEAWTRKYAALSTRRGEVTRSTNGEGEIHADREVKTFVGAWTSRWIAGTEKLRHADLCCTGLSHHGWRAAGIEPFGFSVPAAGLPTKSAAPAPSKRKRPGTET